VIEGIMGLMCVSLAIVVFAPVVGLWVFRPLYQAALKPPPKFQIRLVDLIVLFVQLQILLGLFLAPIPMGQRDADTMTVVTVGVCFVGLLIGLAWLSGVFMLSRVGVARSDLRTVFLGFVAPIGYLITLPIIFRLCRSLFSSGDWQWATRPKA